MGGEQKLPAPILVLFHEQPQIVFDKLWVEAPLQFIHNVYDPIPFAKHDIQEIEQPSGPLRFFFKPEIIERLLVTQIECRDPRFLPLSQRDIVKASLRAQVDIHMNSLTVALLHPFAYLPQ